MVWVNMFAYDHNLPQDQIGEKTFYRVSYLHKVVHYNLKTEFWWKMLKFKKFNFYIIWSIYINNKYAIFRNSNPN